jgi:hypothetical protein
MRPFLLLKGYSQASRNPVPYSDYARRFGFKGLHMKKLLLAATFAALGAVSASAADLPARPYTKAPVMAVDPAYDWSGFYIGGHVGYLWGKTRVVDDGVLTEPGAPTNGVVGVSSAEYWPDTIGKQDRLSWVSKATLVGPTLMETA